MAGVPGGPAGASQMPEAAAPSMAGPERDMAEPLQKIIANRYGGRNLPVTLVLPDGGRVPLSSETEIEILARTWRGLKALAAPAMGALARAYVQNDIDFTGSARRAMAIVDGMVGEISHGRDSLRTRWRLWRHQRRSNRANIGYHYDVSNAFYRLWLDSRLVYSCAYFRADGDTLDDAQTAKLDHICRKLRLQPGEQFLDIGCGWGALLFRAAETYGVQATGITLSKNQFDHVSEEIAARGLAGRVRVELRDYLDLPEDVLYDKIASVGMFEHVGIARFPKYFGKIHRILKPGGFVLNHGITHNPLGAQESRQRHRRLRRGLRVPGRRARARVEGDRGHRRAGARGGRRRGAARALREDAVALVRAPRGQRRRGARGGRRGEVSRVADLSRGLGACVRSRLDFAVAAARRQAAPRRSPAASAHARVHVPASRRMNGPHAHFVRCPPRGSTCPSGGRAGTEPMPPAAESLLEFPTTFPIKVMGRTQDGFAQAIVAVVQRHAPDFDPATMEMRASTAGRYLSLTCTINAVSREQLDNLYRDLSSHPMVAMVL